MTPDWVKDAVFYQIFPDRFRIGQGPLGQPAPVREGFEPWEAPPTLRGFKGGNLWGVIEALDYLQELGFNALYFCPVFSSTANHRYHTSDYFQVDPILGGNEALKRLLEEAHRRGMRVILDGVFNHCGRAHFAFQHVMENEAASPYRDWFHIYKFPLAAYTKHPNYAAWWNNPELPKFNTSSPECRAYLFRVAEYWLEQGIDGWRLDVPNEIDDDEFWREFRRRVKAINPEAYIVGEIWDDASRWLQGDQFDAVMNYPLGRAILGFVGGEALDKDLAARSGLGRLESLGALAFHHRLEDLFGRYRWEVVTAQMNLMTSHDTPRIFTLMRGQVERVSLAFALLFTLPGAPMVYYGDEIGMPGGHDPDNRRGMIWDPEGWQTHIQETIRRMAKLRRLVAPLRYGRYQYLYGQDGHLAFARSHGTESVVVAVNAAPEPWRAQIPLHGIWSRGERAVDLVSGREGRCVGGYLEGGGLEPFSLAVWRVQG
ncbi:Neopullulanase [Meiothermus luteus]|uniref:Neopullulanase n=1 Tax=Meiothermus luteus TaxID=2026184 RepID=A0A399EX70_9DEIN|nr:glycoside hydrolase family 13 protein [Meiothermus luteus]RIH88608.1 Neopullulanase [Meiothermus luteus]RMH57476.1 MAG: glycoside hydrolase family 13 protein [Deinococcota bacterium]